MQVSDPTAHGPRPVRAPRGTELTCRGWQQEAALRMLMNNLDPEVAEDPDAPRRLRRHRPGRAQLGGVRRDRPRAPALADDETLLVQSRQAGRGLPDPPVGARAS